MSALSPRPLNKAQAERFTQALALLKSGQPAQAISIAQALVDERPDAGDAWQLLGICLADSGRPLQSGTAFERALALLPGNVMVSRHYGASLARRGNALRTQSLFEAAEPVLRKAIGLAPELVSAWVDLAVVLRSLGRVEEALAAFQQAETMQRQRGASTLELQDAINGVLAEVGRPADALAGARRLASLHPGHAPTHETLSNLLWEHGDQHAPGEDPLGAFRSASHAHPGDRALQLAFARMLMSAKLPGEALEVLHPLRKREPDNALLDWFAADALDALQQHAQATTLYTAAARGDLANLPEFLNARARHAFRTQTFDLAERCAERAVRLDPENQEAWCHLGTAWRLAGDPREHWLCDYETLVSYVEVAPPEGYKDLPSFLQALRTTLETLHRAGREPVNQSVRGGTQTAGQLFGRDHAVIHAAEAALRKAVEAWMRTLPSNATHPFLARRQRGVRLTGSWSVSLKASGRHSNHIHPKGWASSAFYVALPGSVLESSAESPAGWLQFGQPLEELGLDLPPRRVIQPKPGHLALFPSYLWHGTVPFDAEEPRLTIAFDMQPKA